MSDYTPHGLLCRALELRLQWDEIVHDLALPKAHKELTTKTAAYFIADGHVRNKSRQRYEQALKLASEYFAIYLTDTKP